MELGLALGVEMGVAELFAAAAAGLVEASGVGALGEAVASSWVLAIAWIVVQFLLAVIAADFVSGFMHWIEDSYFSEKTPLIGKWIIAPNMLHHRDPRAFVKNSWLRSADVPLIIAGLVLLGAWGLGLFHWTLVVFVLFAVNAAEFHKWAHRSRTENGRLIVFLQQAGLVQTPAHHAGHHRGGRDRRYCTITNCVNPVVDAVQLWRGLEWVILKLTGVAKRPEEDAPTVQTVIVREQDLQTTPASEHSPVNAPARQEHAADEPGTPAEKPTPEPTMTQRLARSAKEALAAPMRTTADALSNVSTRLPTG